MSSEDREGDPRGLDGWVALVALGLAGSALFLTFRLLIDFVPLFRNGTWGVLTTPGSEAYDPLWAPVLLFELVGTIAFLVAQVAQLVLFFKRSRRFPRLFIWVASFAPPFLLADAWLGSLVSPDEPMFDPDTAQGLIRSAVVLCIWVPYMLRSKRVRNTFVNP